MAERASLAVAIADVVSALSPAARSVLVDRLRAGERWERLREAMAASAYRVAVDRLGEAWRAEPGVDATAVALAIEAAAATRRAEPRLSLVWTGPTTRAISVRRTDQALLALINGASVRVIVVSFAVYRVANVAATLARAAERGVSVDLVVETDAASGGKISFDGWRSLGAGHRLWTWATDRRPVTGSGRVASLHAKCAVADGRQLLISSANLTEFALSLNMELGILIDGGDVPGRVERHFDGLMAMGELVPPPAG